MRGSECKARSVVWGLLRLFCARRVTIVLHVAALERTCRHDVYAPWADGHCKCAVQAARIAAIESDPDVELERMLYERDLQRTRWLIKAYYRARIRKIEQHVQYYLHHPEYTERLSPAELDYAKDFFTCIGRCAFQHRAMPM